jgi:hypothetical protein
MRRSLLALVVIGALAPLLGGCSGGDSESLAASACSHVRSSISLWETAIHATSTKQANMLEAEAYNQLRLALPDAARANSENPEWNPLMTTISESARVSESDLIVALNTQCAGVGNSTSGNANNGPASSSP